MRQEQQQHALPAASRGRLIRPSWARAGLLGAAVEAVLIVVGLIPRFVAVGVAAAILVAYFARGRQLAPGTRRDAVWAVSLSQALVLFVPILLWVLSVIAVLALAAVALVIVVVLLLDR